MEFPAEAKELFTFPMMAGFVTWLVTQILAIWFMVKFKPQKKNRKIEEAIRLGHVVKAVNDGKWDAYNYRQRKEYNCDYVYMVNGRKYKYGYVGRSIPPQELTLYYLNDPGKAFPGMDMMTWGHDMAGLKYALVFIIPLVLGALVIVKLGGI